MHQLVFVIVSVVVSGFVGYMIARMMKKVLKWIATILAVAVLVVIGLTYYNADMSDHAISLTTDVTNRTADVLTRITTSYVNQYDGIGSGAGVAALLVFVVGFYFGIRSS
jgi:amino acid transporter